MMFQLHATTSTLSNKDESPCKSNAPIILDTWEPKIVLATTHEVRHVKCNSCCKIMFFLLFLISKS
jgi:hypothetical protein